MVHIPQCDLRIRGGGQEEVTAVGEESGLGNRFRVEFVGMYELLGVVVSQLAALASQLDIQV